MTLDSCLKVVQILFYITVGITAVLTFISAKRGLLNAVNTEYQKRVMDRLAEVSADLVEQFDWDSSKHLIHSSSSDEVFDTIINEWEPFKIELTETEDRPIGLPTGIPVPQTIYDLLKTVERIQSDPFIPAKLKKDLYEFYDQKGEVMSTVYSNVFSKFQESLAKKETWENLSTHKVRVYRDILLELKEGLISFDYFDNQAHKLRQDIQEYMNQFDSLTK